MRIANQHTYDTNAKYSNAVNILHYKDTLIKATRYPHGVTNKYYSISQPVKLNKNGVITVQDTDTVSAIIKYADGNDRVAALNMASAKTPGGGVTIGARAQEEGLFRCSNLGVSISLDDYPLQDNSLLYTSNAVFFKNFDYNDLECGYTCDIITCAALKLKEDESKPENYVEVTRAKIKSILAIASLHEVDTLILGAWGCGVYKNDPMLISRLFKEELLYNDCKNNFHNIVFAIINDENSLWNNYSIFYNTFFDEKQTS